MSKTTDKSYKKVTKDFLSASTFALVILVELVVFGLVSLHPLNESLAQQIATALITVDGLILGFTILGVTVVAERGFSIPRMTAVFEEHFKKFIDELKVVEASDAEKTAEKLTSSAKSAIVDIIWFPSVLFMAMYFLLASLLTALMLFGVSDTTVSEPLLAAIFQMVMGLSIFFLILGFHSTIQVLKDLTMKTSPKELFKALEEALHRIEQDLKTTTKK